MNPPSFTRFIHAIYLRVASILEWLDFSDLSAYTRGTVTNLWRQDKQ